MTTPTDPLFANQWHFPLIGDIQTIWEDYTGNGINVGVYDDGVQSAHNDLDDNYDASLEVLDGNNQPISGDPNLANNDSHGTAVAGIIGAEANNGEGGVGVAYGSTITGVNIFDANTYGYINATNTAGFLEFLNVVSQADNFDIMSNSWGSTPVFSSAQNNNSQSQGLFIDEYETLSANGRGGLGTIIVQAAGNDTLDANGSGTNSSRHTITVAATDQFGNAQDYTNYGASILITAPAAAVTTDLQGNDGENSAGNADGDPTADTDYTATFGGTSAATPVVSGVVALMLEANSDLGWRDVQNILSTSASHTGSDYGSSATGFEVEAWNTNSASNWNGGGMTYNGSYGYGMVDAFAAVRFAEVWGYLYDTPQVSQNEVSEVSDVAFFSPGLEIPDNDPNGVSFTLNSSNSVNLEHVSLNLSFTHTWVGDLTVFVTDPTGNRVQVLFSGIGFGPGTQNDGDNWTFGLDGFRGVDSAGTWTIEVFDNQAADTGTIGSASLEFFGTAQTSDDIYHYTADVFDYIDVDPSRSSLSDTNGGEDWVNLSSFADDLSINLATNGSGHLTSLANNTEFVSIAKGTVIENIVTGDGNDNIVGNNSDNEIRAMRGDDVVDGRFGNDLIDGGEGNDTLTGFYGDDRIFGGYGDDFISAGIGEDIVIGGRDEDTIYGGSNIDWLYGGYHNDAMYGGSGSDVMRGGHGDDYLYGGYGSDDIYGEIGNDTIFGFQGQDEIYAGEGDDVIGGGDNIDYIFGEEDNDTVRGQSGNDFLYGGQGEDRVNGGDNNDLVDGGTGNDYLTGGNGNDIFVFETNYGYDSISDFDDFGNDRVDLTDFAFVDYTTEVASAMAQVGSHVDIDFGNGDVLRLRNTDLADLDASDFILA